MRSGGDEVVIVVEDTPTRVVLQHILVDAKSGHVTKHWRLDWIFAAPTRFEFTADQTWTMHALSPAQTGGPWTKRVYEARDAPTYRGTGTRSPANGLAHRTSDHTARQLPRREHTKHDGYNLVIGTNRQNHTTKGPTTRN